MVSTTVLLEAGAGSREGRCLDTGRAIVQTAQLGIILHAACNVWGNAIITFFATFDPAPCYKKSRSEHWPDPLSAFRGGVWALD